MGTAAPRPSACCLSGALLHNRIHAGAGVALLAAQARECCDPSPHASLSYPPPLCRLPLPFSLHLPLHLLCLWIVAAGTSLAHMLRAGSAAEAGLAASLSLALVAQLLIGFLLSSLLVYHREDRLRFCFLRSRRAAACLGDPRKGHSSMQEASPLAG